MTTEAASPAQAGRADTGERTRTIAALWRDASSSERTNPAYLVERNGTWQPVGWPEAAQRVDRLAHGLLELGIGKGDTVAVLGSTGLEWVVLDYALASVGAVSVPIYPNSSAAEVGYMLSHSEAVAAFFESDEQRAKLVDGGAGAALRHIVSFAGLDELAARGAVRVETHPRELDEISARIGPDDLYTIIYTSGTTGPPKGCMIRHRNYFAMTSCLDRLPNFVGPEDLMLLYLPLAHNFGRLMHLMGAYAGFTVALLADPYRAAEELPRVRPTVLPSVPRVYEKVQAGVQAKFDATGGARGRLARWAVGVGRQASALRMRGEALPRRLAIQHRLADRLVYSKVKERLGGRLRFGISGGAPLPPEVAEFLHALDVLVLEGYGLTECTTAATVNRPERYRFGTVGPALPAFEVRVADDGEILVRSETVFAGYLRDEAATREAMTSDGWLRTGDTGALDDDGFLTITGRKKDILVTASGKNVAPQNIENALRATPLVSQAVVLGDRRPYVVALLTLDADALAVWAADRGLAGPPEELAAHPDVRAAVDAAVAGVNAQLSRHEQVKRFAILPRDFSVESGELTVTLKVRRLECERRYADEIEALYAAPRAADAEAATTTPPPS